MAWRVIVNPAAGRGRTQRLLPDLTGALAKSAADTSVEVSKAPGEPTRLAHAAADDGYDIVACGGDGVVSEVAGVAAERGRKLAIIPTGAGNDFARVLGYDTRHPLIAIDALEHGTDKVVDLGSVNGRLFTCVTATGFDAEANRWANTVTRLRGTTLYVAAVFRTLAVYRPHPFRVTIDDHIFDLDAWLVAVGNGPAYAGGMKITPGARMDDGLLDVTLVGAMSPFALLRTFPRVFRGTHVSHPAVQVHRGTHVTIESRDGSGAMDVYADGERVGPLPAVMEARPQALTVRVP
ncbi:MAG: diacylglycerol kinase catalytic region [Actinomycetia bacterium]|nr:diacylglycerol kinase catalytic region [Actinomycetes bacterium]